MTYRVMYLTAEDEAEHQDCPDIRSALTVGNELLYLRDCYAITIVNLDARPGEISAWSVEKEAL